MNEPANPTRRLTPEQILEQARQLIGVETEPIEALYPIEYEPIRRYCHAAGDSNPLFLDPEYARATAYGAVLCPPLALRAVTMLPGEPLDSPFPKPPPDLPLLPEIPGAPDVDEPGGRVGILCARAGWRSDLGDESLRGLLLQADQARPEGD